jgi:formylglycine-generating enzyme required for sulfatase activity
MAGLMAERYTQVPRATLWLVQGGELLLGSDDDPGASPSSLVEVGSFYIGKGPITNEQFEAFSPSYQRAPSSPGNDHPAVSVTFQEAVGYCEWYSQLSRKRFRLPTEEEWEFACRGGTRGRYFFGNDLTAADPFVWHRDNSDGVSHPVETKRANPAGVHDMLGLVWEWTSGGTLRGGSYRSGIAEIGSAVRRAADPETGADDVGFRIVRSL